VSSRFTARISLHVFGCFLRSWAREAMRAGDAGTYRALCVRTSMRALREASYRLRTNVRWSRAASRMVSGVTEGFPSMSAPRHEPNRRNGAGRGTPGPYAASRDLDSSR